LGLLANHLLGVGKLKEKKCWKWKDEVHKFDSSVCLTSLLWRASHCQDNSLSDILKKTCSQEKENLRLIACIHHYLSDFHASSSRNSHYTFLIVVVFIIQYTSVCLEFTIQSVQAKQLQKYSCGDGSL
jgi:hypothetical protein